MNRVIIVGAGASGLTAAIFAARGGCRVTVLEAASKAAAKLAATGNGRCNFSNKKIDMSCYRSAQPDRLKPVIESFSWQDAVDFMKSIGILSADRQGYLYPASMQASAVVSSLLIEAESLGVKILTDCPVKKISHGSDGLWRASAEDSREFAAEKLILSAGSYAGIKKRRYKDGMLLARSLELKTEPAVSALTALIAESPIKAWAGVRTEGEIKLFIDGTLKCTDCGELQLTDYGISGIPVFQVSRFASYAVSEGREVVAKLNFMPALNRSELAEELSQRLWLEKRNASEQLIGMFNSKLIPIFCERAGIDTSKQLTLSLCEKLADVISSFELEIKAVNPLAASQVCAGGVSLSEINMETMEALRYPSLYLTGELLDVDGICGGYNLHWCWASGRLAGIAAAKGRTK